MILIFIFANLLFTVPCKVSLFPTEPAVALKRTSTILWLHIRILRIRSTLNWPWNSVSRWPGYWFSASRASPGSSSCYICSNNFLTRQVSLSCRVTAVTVPGSSVFTGVYTAVSCFVDRYDSISSVAVTASSNVPGCLCLTPKATCGCSSWPKILSVISPVFHLLFPLTLKLRLIPGLFALRLKTGLLGSLRVTKLALTSSFRCWKAF